MIFYRIFKALYPMAKADCGETVKARGDKWGLISIGQYPTLPPSGKEERLGYRLQQIDSFLGVE